LPATTLGGVVQTGPSKWLYSLTGSAQSPFHAEPVQILAGLAGQSLFATDISPGFDLLQTAPGTFFDATPFGLGIIPMVGLPIGPGITDTIVERDNGFVCPAPPCLGNTVNIHLFALSLHSAAPINVGGSFFDVFAEIDNSAGVIPLSILPQPDALNPSTGTLTIDANSVQVNAKTTMSLQAKGAMTIGGQSVAIN